MADNLVWVVDRGPHPGAARPLSLRATPPQEGIFKGGLMSKTFQRVWSTAGLLFVGCLIMPTAFAQAA